MTPKQEMQEASKLKVLDAPGITLQDGEGWETLMTEDPRQPQNISNYIMWDLRVCG